MPEAEAHEHEHDRRQSLPRDLQVFAGADDERSRFRSSRSDLGIALSFRIALTVEREAQEAEPPTERARV